MSAIPAGYKQTEVGVIPEDWRCDEVGGFVDLLTGFPFPSSGYSASGVRLLRGSNVKRGCTDWSDSLAAYWPSVTPEIKKYLLKPDDIVVAMDGSLVGRSFASLGKDDVPALLLQRVARLRSGSVSQAYLKAWVCSQRFTNHCDLVKTTTAIPHISPADIRSFEIAVPPTKAEQEAIAEALSDADALIESLEQLLTKKRHLKQAAMQELLTGKKRLPGFGKDQRYKQIESESVPDDWEVTTLSQVSKLPMQNGLFFQPSRKGSGVRLINVGDLFSNAPINSSLLDLFDATAAEQERFKVDSGDLFFTRSSIVPSGIAHCNFYLSNSSESVVFDSHVIRFRPDTKKVAPTFLYRWCIASIARHYLVSKAKTGTMTTIDQSVLGKCPVFLPTINEQIAISAVLSDMDAEIAELEFELDKSRALKQGMMQKLLTGEIRLI